MKNATSKRTYQICGPKVNIQSNTMGNDSRDQEKGAKGIQQIETLFPTKMTKQKLL